MSGPPMLIARGDGPHATCGATTKRKGTPCSKPAGWRTDHAGVGRCYLHGGATPVKHGRYSTIKHERLRTLIEQHAAADDPLNILPELAAARALFQDFVERYEETTAALLAWHLSWEATRRPVPDDMALAFTRVVDEYEIRLEEEGEATEQELGAVALARKFVTYMQGHDETGKPRQVLDLSDAYRIVGEITKIAERIEKVRAANAISRPDFARLMIEMGRVVETYVHDQPTKNKIREGWLAIRL